MRIYHEKSGKLKKVICNMCGNEVKYCKSVTCRESVLREGVFSADFVFGYFSRKDGMRHRFDLCENCYDAMTERFRIPVECTEETEL